MSIEMEMPRYQSHKKVWALEIDSVSHACTSDGDHSLTFRDPGYASIMAPGEMFSRYRPVPGDFYVVYDDGYKSFSPRKAFLDGYTKAAYPPPPLSPHHTPMRLVQPAGEGRGGDFVGSNDERQITCSSSVS